MAATTWKWDGIDVKTGKPRSGRVAASSEDAARSAASAAGAVVVRVRPAAALTSKLKPASASVGKASPRDRASCFRTLALAWATSQPIATALEASKAGLRQRSRLRQSIDRLLGHLDRGIGEVEALRAERKVLGAEAAAVYEAASKSGTPEDALDKLAEITEQAGEIGGKVRSALLLPGVSMGFALVVVAVFMVFIMPTLADTFEQFDGELPLLTRILMGTSGFLTSNAPTVGLALIMVTGAAVWLLRRPDVRLAMSHAAHRMPVTGPILGSMSVQRICALMGVMLNADVQPEVALQTCSEAVPSRSVSERLASAAGDVHDKSLEAVVTTHLAALDMTLEALAVQSRLNPDNPGGTWTRYGDFLTRATERKVKALTDALQPTMTFVVGGIVGLIVIAFYSPMFTVFESISESSGL